MELSVTTEMRIVVSWTDTGTIGIITRSGRYEGTFGRSVEESSPEPAGSIWEQESNTANSEIKSNILRITIWFEDKLTKKIGPDIEIFTKTTSNQIEDMDRYVCILCGYVYDPAEGDPEGGIPAGTPFEELPEDWVCPACGVGKEYFEKER
jgi:rubredoxin